jgi:hypothetical protein
MERTNLVRCLCLINRPLFADLVLISEKHGVSRPGQGKVPIDVDFDAHRSEYSSFDFCAFNAIGPLTAMTLCGCC